MWVGLGGDGGGAMVVNLKGYRLLALVLNTVKCHLTLFKVNKFFTGDFTREYSTYMYD